jgi:protein OS-9
MLSGLDLIPIQTLELVPMKIADPISTQLHDYLCLMPSENVTAAQSQSAQIDEEPEEVDPAVGWAALSHLEGKCLYIRQGWFTYS